MINSMHSTSFTVVIMWRNFVVPLKCRGTEATISSCQVNPDDNNDDKYKFPLRKLKVTKM